MNLYRVPVVFTSGTGKTKKLSYRITANNMWEAQAGASDLVQFLRVKRERLPPYVKITIEWPVILCGRAAPEDV